MESLLKDVRYGLRGLIKAPGFAFVAVVTIALGVGANAAVFSVVNSALLRPLPYPAPEELVRVWPIKRFNELMLSDLQDRVTGFSGVTSYQNVELTLTGPDDPKIVSALIVTATHFEVVGVAPALGRGFVENEQWIGNEAVVVVSHDLWQHSLGADPGIVGRNIDLGGAGYGTLRVIGVMPPGYRPLSAGADAWLPLAMDPDSPAFRAFYGNWVVARLGAGVSVQQASAEVRRLVPDFADEYPIQFRPDRHSPIDVVPLLDTIVADVRTKLLLVFGAVGLLLLTACSNVANLLLARSGARGHEIGIRVALGANRGRVVRQLLTESCLLSLVGGIVGLGLGRAMLGVLAHRIPSYIPRTEQLELDLEVFAFTLAASLLAGLAFGTVPALGATRADPRQSLIGGTRGSTLGRRRQLLNNSLVAVQIALAMVLVIGASLLLTSLYRVSRVDAGFDVERLVAVQVELPERSYGESDLRGAYFESLMEAIRATPAVDVVGSISRLPLTDGNLGVPYEPMGEELPAGTPSLVANARFVSADYFRALGVDLDEGRVFDRGDGESAALVVIVNESFAQRHWGGNPVGRQITTQRGTPFEVTLTIVGVVGDVRQHTLGQSSQPELYFAAAQWGWPLRYVVVRYERPSPTAVADVRAAVRAVDPDVPIAGIWPMSEVVGASLGDPRFYTELFSVFAGLALILGTVGTYGVVSYMAGQRTREIGLRLALGATPEGVLRYVITKGITPVLVGIAGGALLALAVTRLMTGLLYEVSAIDPAVFALVAAVLLMTGLAAGYLPARRAARVDPVEALMAE